MTLAQIFCDENRRNPYPIYEQIRSKSPVLHDPSSDLWIIFDYEGVKRMLSDHETFSSRTGPAEWMIFLDPPRQVKLRALISKAFTPKSVVALEPRIAQVCRELLDPLVARGQMDLALDFAVPLPMRVIGDMLGLPVEDRASFVRWNDAILNMSYTIGRRDQAAADATREFTTITSEMNGYLGGLLDQRRTTPREDLLTRLMQAEVDGERLTHAEILGFFQLLLLAGSETTTNLINNAILCFIEHPDQLARLRAEPRLLPSAIEEVLRFRAPLQWMFRFTRKDAEIQGTTIPARKMVLAILGAANRDPACFDEPDQFNIARDPNPHLAFGHGVHFCLGASLARLESRIALTDLVSRMKHFDRASSEPWEPRKGLHVHGPSRLPIRFDPAR